MRRREQEHVHLVPRQDHDQNKRVRDCVWHKRLEHSVGSAMRRPNRRLQRLCREADGR